MRHLYIAIDWVKNDSPSSSVSELNRRPIPLQESNEQSLCQILDALEHQIITIAQKVMPYLFRNHRTLLDQEQVDKYRTQLGTDVIEPDGYASQKIAGSWGIVHLQRQVCFDSHTGKCIMPSKGLLLEYYGTMNNRALQEWACLFPQDFPFRIVERLLGWQTQQQK